MQSPFPGYTGVVRIVAVCMIVLGILTSCIVQIDAGEIGVQTIFGKVENTILNSVFYYRLTF